MKNDGDASPGERECRDGGTRNRNVAGLHIVAGVALQSECGRSTKTLRSTGAGRCAGSDSGSAGADPADPLASRGRVDERHDARAADVPETTLAGRGPVPASPEVRGRLVRERVNAAVRPILLDFAKRRGLALRHLRPVINSSTPLVEPSVVRDLGGALHSDAMRGAIALNCDRSLVPLQVREGLVRMDAQDLSVPPPDAVQRAFPDWNKALAPRGHCLQSWHPADAAIWLTHFPPDTGLLHPLDTWDPATAALWLNDREAIPQVLPGEGEFDGTVVVFEPNRPWKPSLEVLHTLDELDLEALTYRVFVERVRREVMPFYLSERKIHIRKAVELVTLGYQSLEDARRSVRTHDLQRISYFDRLFGVNDDWIYDLCCRIIAAYAWPEGFAEPELRSDFLDLEIFTQ